MIYIIASHCDYLIQLITFILFISGQLACGGIPDRANCLFPCEKILECGHKCSSLCGQPCTSLSCEVLVPTHKQCPKGHPVHLPCHSAESLQGITSTLIFLITCLMFVDLFEKLLKLSSIVPLLLRE